VPHVSDKELPANPVFPIRQPNTFYTMEFVFQHVLLEHIPLHKDVKAAHQIVQLVHKQLEKLHKFFVHHVLMELFFIKEIVILPVLQICMLVIMELVQTVQQIVHLAHLMLDVVHAIIHYIYIKEIVIHHAHLVHKLFQLVVTNVLLQANLAIIQTVQILAIVILIQIVEVVVD